MTLSERNVFIKAGIIISILCILICIAGSTRILPVYPVMEEEISVRSEGIFQSIIGKKLDVKLMAVHYCIIALVLYSFFTIILIKYFFEKTQSPEILFVVFFAVSFSTEAMRLAIPMGQIYDFPSLYLIFSSRIVLFGRFLGLFSMFAASLFAVGYEAQRQSYIIMVIIVVTLIITIGVPIDTQTWDSSLIMSNGYLSMFRFIEIGIILISISSFFIAAWLRGSRQFAFTGAGSVLVFIGRNIILTSDTWAGPLAAAVCLVFGIRLICKNLHKVYLWL